MCVNELTAEFVKVSLDFPPGVEEDASLLRPHGDHAVLVDGDARHLGVELGHGRALKDSAGQTRTDLGGGSRPAGLTTESSADTRLVRISCRADTNGASPRGPALTPSHDTFLI